MADPVSMFFLGLIATGATGSIGAMSAQDQRAAERKAIEKLQVAHEAQIDVAVAHTESTAEEMRETATETMAASRGQIEAQMAFMGGRGARSGAAIEGAISKAETDWLESIDKETQLILDELAAKREVIGAEASLADISSRIAFTQNIFNAFESMLGGLFTGLNRLVQPSSPGAGTPSTSSQPGPSPSTSRAYKPPVYGGGGF